MTVIEKANCPAGTTKLLRLKAARADALYTDVRSGKTYRGEELRRGLRLELVGGGDQAQLLYFKQTNESK